MIPKLRLLLDDAVIGTGRSGVASVNFFPCDLSDRTSVAHLVANIKPSLIFHLAGSFTGEFDRDFQANVLCAKNIFDAILSTKLHTRIVIFGSAAEYGSVLAKQNPVSEMLECHPVSVYGLTKSYQTKLAQFYARTTGLDVVIARVFNLAIRGQSKILFYGRSEALIGAYKTNEITSMEFGNLGSERDYINEDLATEQILAIAKNGIGGEVYNVGSGVPRTMRAILNEMLGKEGIPLDIVVEKSSESVGRKGIDVPIIYADISKVNSLLEK